jgi:hypothetical protein
VTRIDAIEAALLKLREWAAKYDPPSGSFEGMIQGMEAAARFVNVTLDEADAATTTPDLEEQAP